MPAGFFTRIRHAWEDIQTALVQNALASMALARAREIWRQDGFSGLIALALRLMRPSTRGYRIPDLAEARRAYADWVAQYDTITPDNRARIEAYQASMMKRPTLSVLLPLTENDAPNLAPALRSINAQLYSEWELCVASKNRETSDFIAREKMVSAASGEFIVLVGEGSILAEHALSWIAAERDRDPAADILYSDSDWFDAAGQRIDSFFKPDFDRELALGDNLIGPVFAFRRSLLDTAEVLALAEEGRCFELALRLISQTSRDRVRHIPAVLYHRQRAQTFRDNDNACGAVKEFLRQGGEDADVTALSDGWRRIRYGLPSPEPRVSVIVPTRNGARLLRRCIYGLLKETDYPALDITIVDHESDEQDTKDLLAEAAQDRRVRVLPYSGAFNFSAINNFAVDHTQGELLAFLNNDIQVIAPDWLKEMVSHAARQDVGAVGAMLYYPYGGVQHAGVVLGLRAPAAHLYHLAPRSYRGVNGELSVAREVSAVTAACLVTSRRAFLETGGFDAENLAVAYNDVDLCLRMRERGYRNIFTPHAALVHHGSATRGSDLDPEKLERYQRECDYMMRRWGAIITADPYFNPNLALDATRPELARPPRVTPPWQAMSRAGTQS